MQRFLGEIPPPPPHSKHPTYTPMGPGEGGGRVRPVPCQVTTFWLRGPRPNTICITEFLRGGGGVNVFLFIRIMGGAAELEAKIWIAFIKERHERKY